MKLNKVLALALSGVMAVSMLAGCSTNGNKDDNKDEQVPVADTSIAGVLNDELKDEKIDAVSFQYSTDLQDAVEQVLRVNGGLKKTTQGNDITKDIVTYQEYSQEFFGSLGSKASSQVVGTKVAVTTQVNATGKTAEAVKKEMAQAIADLVKGLETEKEVGNLKYTYTYTGEVAMVTAEDNDMPVYLVTAVVTCKTSAPVEK